LNGDFGKNKTKGAFNEKTRRKNNEMKNKKKRKTQFLLFFLFCEMWDGKTKEKDKKAHKKSQTTQSKNFIFQSG
jgi:CRISPR/Cas system CSM-associated protein Csm4 (group 5 of RAMP superfamily)